MSWRHLGIRAARRVIVAVVGGTLLAIGVVMIVAPGPATVVIPVGLAVLGAEFAWARHWLHRLRETAEKAAVNGKALVNGRRREPPPASGDGASA